MHGARGIQKNAAHALHCCSKTTSSHVKRLALASTIIPENMLHEYFGIIITTVPTLVVLSDEVNDDSEGEDRHMGSREKPGNAQFLETPRV